jgi:hypothetical protein
MTLRLLGHSLIRFELKPLSGPDTKFWVTGLRASIARFRLFRECLRLGIETK